jgi:hypothetical protein
MMWTYVRKSRKHHRCGCGNPIASGEVYLIHVCTPDHEGMGNINWWRIAECVNCAKRYDRGSLLMTKPSAVAPSTESSPAA